MSVLLIKPNCFIPQLAILHDKGHLKLKHVHDIYPTSTLLP